MRRSALSVLATLVLCLISLGGCASGEKYRDVVSRIPPIPQGQGRIFFYRKGILGAAVQPSILLNGTRVGKSVPDGFFFVDRPAGQYEATCRTEVTKRLSFSLQPNQTQYVRTRVTWGVMIGHVPLTLEPEAKALKRLAKTKYIGDYAGMSSGKNP